VIIFSPIFVGARNISPGGTNVLSRKTSKIYIRQGKLLVSMTLQIGDPSFVMTILSLNMVLEHNMGIFIWLCDSMYIFYHKGGGLSPWHVGGRAIVAIKLISLLVCLWTVEFIFPCIWPGFRWQMLAGVDIQEYQCIILYHCVHMHELGLPDHRYLSRTGKATSSWLHSCVITIMGCAQVSCPHRCNF
jgi:hypothetical protein